jgi:gas vesicle protein
MENNEGNTFMENSHRRGSTAVAFMLGALAGGITALLFAPQTGAQMRGRMKEGAKDMRRRGQQLVHEAGERGDTLKGVATEARTAYRDELAKRRAASPSPSSASVGPEEHM